MKKLGDKIEANPIVHTIGKLTGCIDPETGKLRPKSPCAKAKQNLNAGVPLWDVFYDRFWGSKEGLTNQEDSGKVELMEFIVNKTITEQISIDAESMDEAEEKVLKGEGKVISRNRNTSARPRPEAPASQGNLKPPSNPKA